MFDPNAFTAFLRFLNYKPGDLIELRALRGRPYGMQTRNIDKAMSMLVEIAETASLPTRTLVVLNGQEYSRCPVDGMNFLARDMAASGSDITHRRAVLIDLDRGPGLGNAEGGLHPITSDKELVAVEAVALRICRDLAKLLGGDRAVGWALSGNGYHVYVALAQLPETETLAALVKRFSVAVQRIYGSEHVKIDDRSAAALAVPAYGLINQKYAGQEKPDEGRIVRQTWFKHTEDPAGPEGLRLEQLAKLVEELEKLVPPEAVKPAKRSNGRPPKPGSPAAKRQLDFSAVNEIAVLQVLDELGFKDERGYFCPGCGDDKHRSRDGLTTEGGFGSLESKGANLWKCFRGEAQGIGGKDGNGCYSAVDLVVTALNITPVEAVSWLGEKFEIEIRVPVHVSQEEWERLLVRTKEGSVAPTAANVALILEHHAAFANSFAFDQLAEKIVLRRVVELAGVAAGGAWEDAHTAALSVWFSQTYGIEIGTSRLHEIVLVAAKGHSFHPVREYLQSVKVTADTSQRWIDQLVEKLRLSTTPETRDYTRAVVRKTLIAAVARAFEPGCKVDTMLVIEGKQGVFKSRALRALMPVESWYKDDLAQVGKGDEAKKQLAGKWLVEVAELDAMRKSEVDAWKAFASTPVDNYRPSYGRTSVDHPRQCIFVGTVNNSTYLRDETGGRRFWPVKTSATKKNKIDVTWIEQHRDQLWAEAVLAYEAGEKWYLDDKMEAVAEAEAEMRFESDPWEGALKKYLDRDQEYITPTEVMSKVLELQLAQQDNKARLRVCAVLRHLGWTSDTRRHKDKPGPDNRITAYWRPEPSQVEQVMVEEPPPAEEVQVEEMYMEEIHTGTMQEPKPTAEDRTLADALRLMNKSPVSLASLFERFCHSTAMTDARRLLDRRAA